MIAMKRIQINNTSAMTADNTTVTHNKSIITVMISSKLTVT
jgi:hypothetical protein